MSPVSPQTAVRSCFLAPLPSRAGDGTRTRDIKLGRLALYQLSYSRVYPNCGLQRISNCDQLHCELLTTAVPKKNSLHSAHCRVTNRTFECVCWQIYTLSPLTI